MADNGDVRKDFESRICMARCALQERGVRGRDPEEVLSDLGLLLDDRGLDLRTVLGPDAVRVEIIDRLSGEKVSFDREGDDPLGTLMESDLMISTRRVVPELDSDLSIESDGTDAGFSPEERKDMFREASGKFAGRTELRTKGFLSMLREIGNVAGISFDLRYGVPECCDGLTPYSRSQSCSLRITDSVEGCVLWEGRSAVRTEGLDTARMLAFRDVFESAYRDLC